MSISTLRTERDLRCRKTFQWARAQAIHWTRRHWLEIYCPNSCGTDGTTGAILFIKIQSEAKRSEAFRKEHLWNDIPARAMARALVGGNFRWGSALLSSSTGYWYDEISDSIVHIKGQKYPEYIARPIFENYPVDLALAEVLPPEEFGEHPFGQNETWRFALKI